MEVDKKIIISLVESAMSADYTYVRRIGNQLVKQFLDQKDVDGAKAIQSLLRKRGVPLQASGYAESLPRDSSSRSPLVEESSWPSTPIMLSDEIGLGVNQFLEDAKNIDLLSKEGISSRLGLLLYGPPGSGKSLLAGHIAAELKRPLYVARLDSLISSKLGETSKNIRGMFDFIPSKNAVLFIDEMDAIAKLRDDTQELGELKRVVNGVLQGLDSLTDDVVVIGATNHPHLLDSAIWRRFPYKLELGNPIEQVRQSMWLQFLYMNNPLKLVEAQLLAKISENLSGADIENISFAIRRREILGKFNLTPAQTILAVISAVSGKLNFLENKELDTEDKRKIALILQDKGNLTQQDIADFIGVTRQMVHRYLKENEHA